MITHQASDVLTSLDVTAVKAWAVFHPRKYLMWWTISPLKKVATWKIAHDYDEKWSSLEQKGYRVGIVWIIPAEGRKP